MLTGNIDIKLKEWQLADRQGTGILRLFGNRRLLHRTVESLISRIFDQHYIGRVENLHSQNPSLSSFPVHISLHCPQPCSHSPA
jgi:hypothetical protein